MRPLYTGVMLALVCGGTAHAAKNEEIVRYPSLLMLGPVSQALSVSYSFSDHATDDSYSSGSALRESYSFNTTAAILNPHLVSMQILAGISYSQNFNDETSKLLDGEYNVVASAFDMSYHPFVINSFRTTSLVSNGYTPTYSQTTNTNQISGSLLNATLPVSAQYMHSTSQTDGLEVDSESVTDAVSLSTYHNYREVSSTRASISHARSQSGPSQSSSYSTSLRNNLAFDAKRRYVLFSNADLFESRSGGVPQKTFSLSEEMNLPLGRALTGRISDRYNYNSTRDFDDNEQSSWTNSVSGSLSHSLYRSLATSISGVYSTGATDNGTTSSYGGSLRVAYSKALPRSANLKLTLNRSRNINSQDLQDSELAARDEAHLGVQWGDRIQPLLVGTLTSVRSVRSLNQTPELEYVEGVDYRVDTRLGEIEIIFGGGIVPGTDIAISYTVAVDPTLRYQTDAFHVSSSLSLLSGRYGLSGGLSQNDQKVLSGEARNQTLVSSTALVLRAQANYDPTQLGVEYTLVDSTQEQSWRMDAFGSHNLRTADNASVSFSARNSYSVLEAVSREGESYWQNTFSIAASYSRRFLRWLKFSSSVAFSDSRSESSSVDFVSVRGALSGTYNQLQFSLATQTLYRVSGAGESRDSNFNCTITRFF